MSYKHKEIRTEVVDLATGEVVSEKKVQTFNSQSEPAFVKMYIDDIASMMKLNATATKLLTCLATRIGYDSIITLSPFIKRQIAQDMNIKNTQTVDNNISLLISHGAMMRKGRSTFMLNPDYFARGKWQDISRLKNAYIELTVIYSNGIKKTTATVKTGVHKDLSGDYCIITEDGERIELT